MGCAVAWFTGLSGSGKSAIARLAAEILTEQGQKVLVLDGDDVRARQHRHLGYSPEGIRENNRLIAQLCQGSMAKYNVILVPIISPFRDSRESARRLLGPGFVEVYVRASLEEVMRRDPKGLYEKVKQGRLPGFIGVDREVPYESPESAELVLETESLGVKECATQLVELLLDRVAAA